MNISKDVENTIFIEYFRQVRVVLRKGVDKKIVGTIFNPISYGLSDSVAPTGGGPISRKELSLTPCCYIAFVCLYI